MVEQGTTIHILKRYKPVAVINAEKFAMPNKNKKRIPGLLKNTVTILGDITGPVLDKEEWGSLWLDDSKD